MPSPPTPVKALHRAGGASTGWAGIQEAGGDLSWREEGTCCDMVAWSGVSVSWRLSLEQTYEQRNASGRSLSSQVWRLSHWRTGTQLWAWNLRCCDRLRHHLHGNGLLHMP